MDHFLFCFQSPHGCSETPILPWTAAYSNGLKKKGWRNRGGSEDGGNWFCLYHALGMDTANSTLCCPNQAKNLLQNITKNLSKMEEWHLLYNQAQLLDMTLLGCFPAQHWSCCHVKKICHVLLKQKEKEKEKERGGRVEGGGVKKGREVLAPPPCGVPGHNGCFRSAFWELPLHPRSLPLWDDRLWGCSFFFMKK